MSCDSAFLNKFCLNWRVILIEMKDTSPAISEIPWWNKYTLSVQEAAEYFGICDKKIRKIIEEHQNERFIMWNGSRPRIKRKLFEKYVDEKLTVI